MQQPQYTQENPQQTVKQIQQRHLDPFTREFWRECGWLEPHLKGLDNYKKRSSVLILYAGNNTTSGELMINATGWDTNHHDIEKFVELILTVVPKYDYKTVIFDRCTESLNTQILKNLDYISTEVHKHYPDLCMICLSGTINSKDYNAQCPGVRLIGTASFLLRDPNNQSNEFNEIQYEPSNRNRVFLNLNRVAKIPRLYALAELINQGLLPYSLTSFSFLDGNNQPVQDYSKMVKSGIFNCTKHSANECGGIPEDLRTKNMTYISDIVNQHLFQTDLCKSNMVIDRPDVFDSNPAMVNHTEHQMFRDTWFSLVQETHTNIFFGSAELPNGVFISEKTAKVLAHKHPFFMFSTPGHLRELRNLGFQTFSELWDESYDLITDPVARYQAILKEIDRLCDLTQSDWVEMHKKLEPIVNHNHHLFFTQTFKMVNIDKPILLP